MKHDVDSELYLYKNNPIFYYLLEGLTYNEIARKYYCFNKNKFVYAVRKLLKRFNLTNRRQLVYFAVLNELVEIKYAKFYG